MAKKTLLLDASYQVQHFIDIRKALKHIFKDKVEVVSNWDDYISYGSGRIKHPAILRLKNTVKRNYYNTSFSRKAIVKRDRSSCQYCGKVLSAANVTMDHVLPRAQGGITSLLNCVVACQPCNNKKGHNTPEQAGMPLLKKIQHPAFASLRYVVDSTDHWHESWDDFLNR